MATIKNIILLALTVLIEDGGSDVSYWGDTLRLYDGKFENLKKLREE